MQFFSNFACVRFLIGRVACARARGRARRVRACVRVACARVRDKKSAGAREFLENLACAKIIFRVRIRRVRDANRVSDVCACESFQDFACVEILFLGLTRDTLCAMLFLLGKRPCEWSFYDYFQDPQADLP